MKKSKKLWLIVLILLLFLIIIRFKFTTTTHSSKVYMLGNTNLSLSHDEMNRLSRLNSRKTIYSFNSERILPAQKNDSIIVRDTLRFSADVEIKYFIEDFDISIMRFIPLYRPIDYKANVIYEWTANVKSKQGDFKVINQSRLRVEGDYSISGIILPRDPKKKIMSNMYDTVEKELRNEIQNKVYEVIKNHN